MLAATGRAGGAVAVAAMMRDAVMPEDLRIIDAGHLAPVRPAHVDHVNGGYVARRFTDRHAVTITVAGCPPT